MRDTNKIDEGGVRHVHHKHVPDSTKSPREELDKRASGWKWPHEFSAKCKIPLLELAKPPHQKNAPLKVAA